MTPEQEELFLNEVRRHAERKTRWRHQGRNDQGLDCAGLIVGSMVSLGLLSKEYDVASYSRRSINGDFLFYFRRAGFKDVPVTDMRRGDMVVFTHHTFACHVGVYTGEKTFVHAYALRKCVVEEALTEDWFKKLVTVLRYEGAT